MTTAINDIFTVAEVAEMLGITTGRLRQICLREGLGTIVGNTKVFTKAEVDQLLALPRTNGRPRKNSA